MLMIKNTKHISVEALKDLKNLAALCRLQDNSTPNLYLHILAQPRSVPASLFYYQEQQLLGFLAAYFFYEEAVELALLVHPNYRRQGIAKLLVQAILPLIEAQNYRGLIFSSPNGLNQECFLKQRYCYSHSEYQMKRRDLSPILERRHLLKFRQASLDDLDTLSALDGLCFPNKHPNLGDRFINLLNNKEYSLLLALDGEQAIGKIHIRWEADGASLSDIAVYPEAQGKGYGTALVSHSINHALQKGKPLLSLDVETHNEPSLNLYKRLGFFVDNACDFWRIDLERLKQVT